MDSPSVKQPHTNVQVANLVGHTGTEPALLVKAGAMNISALSGYEAISRRF
jgi:hypothetical protein